MLMDSLRSTRGMAVAPHALASQSALAVLRENGNALEAMIAAAATIAVVYRRMNSIGGDAFWLMHVLADVHGTYAAGAIDACGAAARAASIEWYRERGIPTIAPCYRSVKAINEGAGASRGSEHQFFYRTRWRRHTRSSRAFARRSMSSRIEGETTNSSCRPCVRDGRCVQGLRPTIPQPGVYRRSRYQRLREGKGRLAEPQRG